MDESDTRREFVPRRRLGSLTYLLSVDDIHNHTTLQHACQPSLDLEAGLLLSIGGIPAIDDGEFVGHAAGLGSLRVYWPCVRVVALEEREREECTAGFRLKSWL